MYAVYYEFYSFVFVTSMDMLQLLSLLRLGRNAWTKSSCLSSSLLRLLDMNTCMWHQKSVSWQACFILRQVLLAFAWHISQFCCLCTCRFNCTSFVGLKNLENSPWEGRTARCTLSRWLCLIAVHLPGTTLILWSTSQDPHTHCKCCRELGHSTPKPNSSTHEFVFGGILGFGERERYGRDAADDQREHKRGDGGRHYPELLFSLLLTGWKSVSPEQSRG